MLDRLKVRAISLDLDDTLWPIWPTIARAEAALQDWLRSRAPLSSALLVDPAVRHELRQQALDLHPAISHQLSAVRREMIRLALARCGEDQALAVPAYEVFFEVRQQVDLFDDALPTLEALAARYPLVALSNGNADVGRVGLGRFFKAGLSAEALGFGKPDPRIFHAAAQAAGVPAEAVLHIGDDAALDVLGALACGMQTVWVNREDHLWTHEARPHDTVTCLAELPGLLN
jgi:putative hydrolase of the HAD superfamily